MMRSMYSGVSALRAHQTRMDVIGNNIANVNTVGFKASKVTFAEAFNQTLSGAGSSSDSGRGGTNPQQVGLGANLSSITVYHTQGATQRTDNQTDIMIDGNGYFILSPDSSGENKFYSRAGNFTVDRLGFLVAPNGYKVLDEDFEPVQINQSETMNATESSQIALQGNLDFNEEIDALTDIAYSTTVDLYNSVGDTNTITVNFGEKYTTQPGADPGFSYRMIQIPSPDGDATNNIGALTDANIADGTSTAAFDSTDPATNAIFVEFDEAGNFTRIVDQLDFTAVGGTLYVDTADTQDELGNATPDGLNDLANTITPTVTLQSGGVDDVTFTLNEEMFTDFSHYSQTTDAKAVPIDGNSAGVIENFTISSNGEVVGIFTNGERTTLATVGLADFDNPSGLLKVGGNLFSETVNSGTPKYGAPASGSMGALTPGALEMSNVDLSAEFTDMITTQRGFQANSRVITTSDEILQELVNLKR